MIGDALGDYQAAKIAHALFFPILPGREETSWRRLFEEAYPRFLAGAYRGAYQNSLVAEMERALPEKPPWNKSLLQ